MGTSQEKISAWLGLELRVYKLMKWGKERKVLYQIQTDLNVFLLPLIFIKVHFILKYLLDVKAFEIRRDWEG